MGRKQKLIRHKASFDSMERIHGPKYKSLVDRAREGSLTAAIKLKCLDCSCWQPDEIRHCPCVECSLFPLRPYQKKET